MFKRALLLLLCCCTGVSSVQAQQIVDPLEVTVQGQVINVSSLVTIDNDVYFLAELKNASSPLALLKFNAASQQFNTVAPLPARTQLVPSFTGIDGHDTLIPVKHLLFMPDHRQWFDPATQQFRTIFAKAPPSFKARCKLTFDQDLRLDCIELQGAVQKRLFYRLNAADLMFYAAEPFATADSHNSNPDYGANAKDGLLCGYGQQGCFDTRHLRHYASADSFIDVQQDYLHSRLPDHTILRFNRQTGEQHLLDLSALSTEVSGSSEPDLLGFSKDYVLYSTKRTAEGVQQIKRLHLPSQQVQLIEFGSQPYTSNAVYPISADGSFLLSSYRYYRGDYSSQKALLTADTSKPKLIEQEDSLRHSASQISHRIALATVNAGALVATDPCRPYQCKTPDSPEFYFVSTQGHTPLTLKSLPGRPDTPIRQLTSWQQQLFWHETAEQPRFKRLQPRTGQVDIVADNQQGQLLAGSSNLWLYSADHFYRFNTTSNKFDSAGVAATKSLTAPAEPNTDLGVLVDDNYYYFVNSPVFGNSSSLQRFNLATGQHQQLKLFDGFEVSRILGVSQGKLFLSFQHNNDEVPYDEKYSGGVLDLTSLTLETNTALSARQYSGGMIVYQDSLLRVFEFKQQLYGFSNTAAMTDWGRSSSTQFWRINLKQQVREYIGASLKHAGHAIIVNDSMVTSAGEQYSVDGRFIKQWSAERFQQAIRYGNSIYLLGDSLQKLQPDAAELPSSQVTLGHNVYINPDARMAEVAGKLYVVATDATHGERIRQIQLDNRPPQAMDDSATTNNTSAVLIDVLKNDSDADLDTLSVLDAKAGQGTVTIQANQQLHYQPKTGFSGVDEVNYTISDGRGGQHSAKVVITVSATPVEPPQQPSTTDSAKSGGAMSSLWCFILAMLACWRGALRYRTAAQQPAQCMRQAQARFAPPWRAVTVLLSFCSTAALLLYGPALQAQQLIDPLESTVQRPVSSLMRKLFVLDQQIYTVGQLEQGKFAILRVDPSTRRSYKEVDLLESQSKHLGFGSDDDGTDIVQIGNRLLINHKWWFVPGFAELINALDPALNNRRLDNCKLQFDSNIVLSCGWGAHNYRLNRADMTFYADTSTAPSGNSFTADGLFCQLNQSNTAQSTELSYDCAESGSTQVYAKITGTAFGYDYQPLVQRNYIFFKFKDHIVMQQRQQNVRTRLNIAALQDKMHGSVTIQAVSPESLLFTTYHDGKRALKRLHIASQRIDVIDTGPLEQLAGDWAVLSAITLSDSGSFLIQNYDESLFRLTSSQTQPEPIHLVKTYRNDGYRYSTPWVQWAAGTGADYSLLTLTDTCRRANRFFDYLSCDAGAPLLQQINERQVTPMTVPQVSAKPQTPLRQLTQWNKNIFWYEYNEHWQIKRYQPQSGRTDIVDLEPVQAFHEPVSRKLLAGPTALWQLKKQEFYRFDPQTNKFEANGTSGALATTSPGLLIDNDYYYFAIIPSPVNPLSFSTSFRKFNLVTGQYQELKRFDDLKVSRLFHVSPGKFYLTLQYPNSGRYAGILQLDTLTIEPFNLLFYASRFMFTYKEQLFGIGVSFADPYSRKLYQVGLQERSLTPLADVTAPRGDAAAEDRMTLLGNYALLSSGKTINLDTVDVFDGVRFQQSVGYQQAVYLLGDGIYKVRLQGGQLQTETVKLPDYVTTSSTSSMVELDGKLYFVGHDNSHGERIWQLPL